MLINSAFHCGFVRAVNKMKIIKNVVILLLFVSATQSAKILCVFNIAAISHQIVYQPIWKELSLRGHEVTVITPNPLKDAKLTNLTEIDLSYLYQFRDHDWAVASGMDHWKITKLIHKASPPLAEELFRNPEVQSLIHNTSKQFDVVLAEYVIPFVGVFAARFKCPLIAVASLGVSVTTHDAIGNPTHPLFSPDFTANFGENPSFAERIDAVLFAIWERYYHYYVTQPMVDRIIKKYFGENAPDLVEIDRNISMIFLNTNPVLHGAKPNLPSVVQMGRMHLKPKKPLPQVCMFTEISV